MSGPTVWCPSCGDEFVAGSRSCPDCRVALVAEPPGADGTAEAPGWDLVELGSWPRLEALVLRRRLEATGLSVMVEWTGPGPDATGTIVVPEGQADFADAVVREVPVDEEVPDTSPEAYLDRIETRLAEVAGLMEELRARLAGLADLEGTADEDG